MVIHQFNKLIRNKWVWGVFAVLVSAAFCFDDVFTSRGGAEDRRSSGGAGSLGGEPVDADEFNDIAEDVRGFGQRRDWRRSSWEVNREAWENYAAIKTAEKDGIEATDSEVQAMIRSDPSFHKNGAFSFAAYEQLLRQNGFTPQRFEEYLKRTTTLRRVSQSVLGGAAWVSTMELDQAVADMTDTFTVKVATFAQDGKAAAAVKVDDAAVKKWYEEHKKSLELPERVRIRYVRFNAAASNVLARMTVTEDEMKDRYDVTVDKYTSTDTNGVEKVKKFEEVKAEIEKDLRLIAAVQYFETNLNQRVYSDNASTGGVSRLDEIAKADGLKVETSDWFSVDGGFQEGFMKPPSQILPGANGFTEAVAELDSSSEDLRYGVVSSDRFVWLIEKAETSARHVPTFEEAKEAVRPRALRDARADAFKAVVEAVRAKGADAVRAVKGVTTNIVFSVSDIRGTSSFDNQMAVVRAATKLKKGEVSEFTLVSPGRAILVVCEDRAPGDAAKAMVLRSQVRDELAMLQLRQIPDSWKKWNLDRIGFTTTDASSVEVVKEEE
ncbi:MAG: SurA N-terminal domain-containing protein [Kiritimatiellae bacterium]|nr:SurA N-terminal domain-containing protein [Kiritimatiellia bacterium]